MSAGAVARLIATSIILPIVPLHVVLRHLRLRKEKIQVSCAPPTLFLEQAASLFKLGSLLATPLDHCLPRSVWAAHCLLDRGILPDLIFGVRLNPFSAHCWVQCGETVMNDRLDDVRNYTPILVL